MVPRAVPTCGRGPFVRGLERNEAAPHAAARGAIGADDTATSRLELVFGREGVRRLAASKVVVFGVGGVGSSCVEALARGGVGRLVIVDGDAVQRSNVNRQALAFHSTVGRRKVEVMRAMVADINPDAQVTALDRFVLPDEVTALMDEVASDADYVVDAVDTVGTKLAIAQYADQRGLRLVSSMGAANKLRPDCFRFADIYQTSNDPLCRVVRKEARKRGIKRLEVLYSTEEPARLPVFEDAPDEEPAARTQGAHEAVASQDAPPRRRPTLGTASYAPPIMGQMIAGHVIRGLLGIKG